MAQQLRGHFALTEKPRSCPQYQHGVHNTYVNLVNSTGTRHTHDAQIFKQNTHGLKEKLIKSHRIKAASMNLK